MGFHGKSVVLGYVLLWPNIIVGYIGVNTSHNSGTMGYIYILYVLYITYLLYIIYYILYCIIYIYTCMYIYIYDQ